MADISITAASVSASNQAIIRREYPAGATITAGQVVYKDANNRWSLFDSDVGAGLGANIGDLTGIALHNSANTQPLAVATSDPNFGVGGTVANGVPYYGSNVAGGITATTPTTGNYTLILGVARSASRLNLNPTASGVAV